MVAPRWAVRDRLGALLLAGDSGSGFTERRQLDWLRGPEMGLHAFDVLADGQWFRRGCVTVRFSGVADPQLVTMSTSFFVGAAGGRGKPSTIAVAVNVAVSQTSLRASTSELIAA